MLTLDEIKIAPPINAAATSELLTVELDDGRIISVPTKWYPRLAHGNDEERARWTLSHTGIHWECLDEDISVIGLLVGLPSNENPEMIELWKKSRENVYELRHPKRTESANG